MGLERATSEDRKRLPVADQIRKGLEEAIRHAKGEITLKTTMVEIPDPPPEILPEELTKLRTDNRMSQDVFARVLNVSTRSVRKLGRGDTATLAGGAAADPGLPPEHLGRPRGGRHGHRSGVRRPEEAHASNALEEAHAARCDDLTAWQRAGR
jgi:DNA-binding transcriptional regulator YiaG